MGVNGTPDPSVCNAWLNEKLMASALLVEIHGGGADPRIWQELRIPPPDDGRDYPYLYWMGGKIDVTQFYARESEEWGRIVSRYTVASVRRFDGAADEEIFRPAYKELLRVLCGVVAQDVIVEGEGKIGEVYRSRYKADYKHGYKDGESRIFEFGIVIDVMHK